MIYSSAGSSSSLRHAAEELHLVAAQMANIDEAFDAVIASSADAISGPTLTPALSRVLNSLPADGGSGQVATRLVADALERIAESLDAHQASASDIAAQVESLEGDPVHAVSRLPDLIQEWRDHTNAIASARRHAAAAIRDAAALAVHAEADAEAHGWRRRLRDFGHGLVDGLREVRHLGAEFAGGLWDNTGGVVVAVVKLAGWDLTFQVVADPGKWARNWERLGIFGFHVAELGLVAYEPTLLQDPRIRQDVLSTASVILNVDELRKDPARWAGGLLPTLVAAIATDGGSTVAEASRGGALRDALAPGDRIVARSPHPGGGLSDKAVQTVSQRVEYRTQLLARDGRIDFRDSPNVGGDTKPIAYVNGRQAHNGKWADLPYRGEKWTDELQTRYGDVWFRATGFPIFHPFAKIVVESGDFIGTNADYRTADRIAGITPDDRVSWEWNHVEDGRTLELIPADLHEAVRHTGGRALNRGDE